DYIAPEQALDAHQADIRADIYSLGCTLYHLLAGRPPFPEGSSLRKLIAHQERTPTPLAEIRRDVPPELALVLDRMMAKDSAHRYQTPAEVVHALAPFAARLTTSSTTVTLPSPRHPVTRSPRHRFKVGAAVLLSAALLAFTIWYGASYVRGRLEATPERTTSPPALGDIPVIGGDTGPFSSVAFSPDARRALVAGPDHVLQLWDLERGKEITRLPGHFDTVLAIAIAPTGE